ncbi:MAG: TIGR04013 family B12-binding domain/radical SAM domain-containing protein, partial [Candidatus Heimdallarchaeota archaeon]
TAILVRWRPKNYYSFSSLVPILKSFGYPLFLLLKDPIKTFKHTLNEFNKIYYFDSFMTIDVPKIKKELNEYQSIFGSKEKVVYCAGGSHPTAAPEHTLSLGFNIVARGEGEIIVKRIIEVIQANKSWFDIPGITFKDDSNFLHHTPNPPRINLDDYLPYSVDPPITPPIEIMRGCSFGCKFCQTPRVLRKVRYRSIESIDKIVAFYAKKFVTRRSIDIRFIAPNSLEYGSKDHRKPNIEALWSLVKTVKKYSVRMFLGSFPSEIRPEFINPETVEVLQQSDSKKVAVGAQSGSDSMLNKMKRGHSLQDIINGVNYLIDGDLIPQLDFILGNPQETEKEQFQTLNLCRELLDKGCRIRLHYFMPLPGTPWGDAPPSILTSVVKTEIFNLLNHPLVDGSFSQQMEIADPLLQYR